MLQFGKFKNNEFYHFVFQFEKLLNCANNL